MGIVELEEYYKQFGRISEDAHELTEGLSEAQFTWRPEPELWSIQECFAHLTIVGQQEVRAIERAIEDAKSRGLTGGGPFRYGWLERTILRNTEPPVRRRLPAPRRFRPVHGQPVTAILPTFLHVQSQFQHLVEQADGLDLARVKVPTPLTRLLRLSLGITIAQAAAHERRHLWQARAVRHNPGFPGTR